MEQEIKIIKDSISLDELKNMAREHFGDWIKAVVDLEQKIMAVGGEMHSDEEALLLKQGSRQENLWGINILVDMPKDSYIEFDSMINIRPRQGNRSRFVENPEIQNQIITVVNNIIE